MKVMIVQLRIAAITCRIADERADVLVVVEQVLLFRRSIRVRGRQPVFENALKLQPQPLGSRAQTIRLGNRNGFGVGKGAEIPTRTAHDIGQQSDIRGGEAKRLQFAPKGE